MKTKKIRVHQGFTIVELVIVVGVIGILTAVLVPTFINLNKKAEEASNQSFVKNLNTQMALREQEEGKNATMFEAVEEAKDIGFDVEKLTPVDGRDLVWDSVANRFALLNPNGSTFYADGELKGKNEQIWKMYGSMPQDQSYSIYAKTGWDTANVGTTEKPLAVGFDAGHNGNIASVSYVNTGATAKDVVIRTNGGSLTIDAPNDVVTHYSDVDSVSIERIAGSSYHEKGRVRVSLELKDGHAVVEPNGFVNELKVPEAAPASTKVDIQPKGSVNTAVVDSASAKFVAKNDAQIGTVIAAENNSNVEVPSSIGAKLDQKTEVSTGEELAAALEAKKPYIALTKDVEGDKFTVVSSTVIDGQGHKILDNTAKGRAIWVDNDNVTLSVKNLVIDGQNKCERAVQINSGKKNVDLSIDSLEATGISYYAINVCSDVEAKLSITNSKITGWGALNLWSEKYSVYVSNSELNGINDKGYNADGWNDFGTVILEGDTTGKTTEHSSEVDVKIFNTKITASQTTGNKQFLILFNDPSTANTVSLSGCTLQCMDNNRAYLVMGNVQGNKLYIDGKLVENAA